MNRFIQVFTCLSLLYSSDLYSQNYSLNQIPDSLFKNANAVFFVDEGEFEIIDAEKSIFKTHQVVAILNEDAKTFGSKTIGYDKIRKINSLSAVMYDRNGKIIRKSKNSDIEDYSATSQNNLFDDNRLQHLDVSQNQYPYIVEYWIEQEYKTTYITPNWYVLPSYGTSVIHSKFSVVSPEEYNPNFSIQNSDQLFEISQSNGLVHSSISFDNILAEHREPYGPSLYEFSPVIYSSPSKFSFEGFVGDFSSWDKIGYWQLELNKGRDVLSDETISTIKKLTDDAETREEKIKRIYEFVQGRTRYVSIQLGIGGMQPFPAQQVDELGYGDCKALSNYTQALLKSVNIDSYYTWVYGGSNPPKLDSKFPIHRFNHVILSVPNESDTLWLECTSQTNPFGYLGDFTGDRDVLLITENGGKLVKTPSYRSSDNQQITVGNVDLTNRNTSQANIQITYSGLQYENQNLNFVLNDGNDKLKDWVYKNTEIENFTVVDFNFDFKEDKIPSVTEDLELEISNLMSQSGKRYFLVPNLLNKWKHVPKAVKDRKTNMILNMDFEDMDSLSYRLPPEFSLEYMPKDIHIDSPFGSYEVNYQLIDNHLIFVRKVNLKKGTYSKELYTDFRTFYRDIVRGDRAKVVLIDKT